MSKKFISKISVSSKALIAGAAALALVAGAIMIAGHSGSDGNLSDIRNIIEQFNFIKNEDSGCCLPLCENYGKTECEQRGGINWVSQSCDRTQECSLGCCQVSCKVKENFPQDSCLHSEGQWSMGACVMGCCQYDGGSVLTPEHLCVSCMDGTWKEEACGPGFSVSMDSTFSTVFLGQSLNQTLKIDLHTCANTVYSTWTGTEIINTNGDIKTVPIMVQLQDGKFVYSNPEAASIYYEASVTESKMNMKMSAGLANFAHNLQGDIQIGSPDCAKNLE